MYRLIAGLSLILLVSSTSAFAVPETFDVRLNVRTPIIIIEVADLNFGFVDVPPVVPLPLLVDPALGAGAQPGAGTGARAAEFSMTGTALAVADVDFLLPTVDIVNLPTTITVTLTTSTPTVTFPTVNVFVGGTLSVPVGATIGAYIGVATLTIIYQ